MTFPKISIIVPVYNTETYLRRCIDSILSQTFKEFEILLIDDGSTDGSYDIIQEYAGLDLRIRGFHQENSGVTSARKLGVQKSRGEWVSFVDSDDELFPEALSVLYSYVRNNIDIIVSDYSESRIITGDDFVRMTLSSKLYTSIWGRLYRKQCVETQIDNISNKITIGEDSILNIKIGCNLNNNVSLIKHKVYKYYETPGSAMRTRVVSLQYEEYFMSELRCALGDRYEEFKEGFYLSCLSSLETLIVSRVSVPYDCMWVNQLISWKKTSKVKLNLRQWIVMNVRHNIIARYILAAERRFRLIFNR